MKLTFSRCVVEEPKARNAKNVNDVGSASSVEHATRDTNNQYNNTNWSSSKHATTSIGDIDEQQS